MRLRQTTLLCGFLLGFMTSGPMLGPRTAAQVPGEELRRLIAVESWSSDELKRLDAGSPVVRLIPTAEKQEIATLGVLLLRELRPISMAEFRQSLDRKRSDELKTGGKLSQPANLNDLRNLELDKSTVKQLEKCTTGQCDLNLSAEMIKRFQNEIDWNSAEVEKGGTKLFREMLIKQALAYAARGDAALGTYDNRQKTVDLANIHRSLLANASVVQALAPEFVEYLRTYPKGTLEEVANSMRWSVVDFGLKPTITLSHTAAFTQLKNGAEQHFIASKQIYSSRYLDASLTFTLLLRVADSGRTDTYIVFLDRSRSDAFEGPVGRFARNIVVQESAKRVTTLLDEAAVRLSARSKPAATVGLSEVEQKSMLEKLSGFARRRAVLLIALAAIAMMIFALWIGSRARRRDSMCLSDSRSLLR